MFLVMLQWLCACVFFLYYPLSIVTLEQIQARHSVVTRCGKTPAILRSSSGDEARAMEVYGLVLCNTFVLCSLDQGLHAGVIAKKMRQDRMRERSPSPVGIAVSPRFLINSD